MDCPLIYNTTENSPIIGSQVTFLWRKNTFTKKQKKLWSQNLNIVKTHGIAIIQILKLKTLQPKNDRFSRDLVMTKALWLRNSKAVGAGGTVAPADFDRGGALFVEMGFYADISWESKCNIKINVWAHFYKILLVYEVTYYPKPQVKWMTGKS